MDKWDNLLIRACKKRGNIEIFRRILARRCGMGKHFIDDYFIAEKLMSIVQRYNNKDAFHLLFECSPEQAWRFITAQNQPTDNYWHRVIRVAASILKLTEVKKFPDYTAPLWFRARK